MHERVVLTSYLEVKYQNIIRAFGYPMAISISFA